MRVVLLAAVLTGCGFSASSPAGPPPIDAPASVADSAPGAIDAPPGASDAPVVIDAPMAMIDAPMATIDAPTVHNCGTSYVTVTGSGTQSKYRRVNSLTTWQTAKATCAQDTAYLVIPETLTEGTAVSQFVSPDSGSPYYWAGIEDPNNDNVWTTVLGQTFASPPFQSGVRALTSGAPTPRSSSETYKQS